MVVLDRLVNVGEGLRLDALGGIDHQQRAFARGEAAADFVGEIDVAGGVHQVEFVGLAVVCGVVQPHRLGLDRDPALFLYVHVIKHLRRHLALGQPAGELDQAVSQRRLAMIDMGNDGKVADQGQVGHPGPLAARNCPVSSAIRQYGPVWP